MEEDKEWGRDWHWCDKGLETEFKVKMLQFLSPAKVSVVSQFENGKCLSLDSKLGRMNLV